MDFTPRGCILGINLISKRVRHNDANLVILRNTLQARLNVRVLNVLRNVLRGGLNLIYFDGAVKKIQQKYLKKPQQHQNYQRKRSKICKNLPFDAPRANPLEQAEFLMVQSDTPRL